MMIRKQSASSNIITTHGSYGHGGISDGARREEHFRGDRCEVRLPWAVVMVMRVPIAPRNRGVRRHRGKDVGLGEIDTAKRQRGFMIIK